MSERNDLIEAINAHAEAVGYESAKYQATLQSASVEWLTAELQRIEDLAQYGWHPFTLED